LGSLTRAWCSIQPDDFIRKLETLNADLLHQLIPSGIEDEISVLDLKVDSIRSGRFFGVGCGFGFVS
jgi:hypothetical protein